MSFSDFKKKCFETWKYRKMNKKGRLEILLSGLFTLFMIMFSASIMANLLTTVRDTNTQNNTAWNLTNKALTDGLAKLGDYWSILITILIFAVVIGYFFFAVGRKEGGL